MAKAQPDNLAIIIQKPLGQFAEHSYRELEEYSNKIAAGLIKNGISKGTRVALMVQPGWEFFGIVFALFKIGAVLIAIDPGLGIRGLKKCLEESEPQAFIGILKADIARRIFKWGIQTIYIHILVSPLTKYFSDVITLNTVIKSSDQPFDPSSNITDKKDMAAILFTSGSTGIPKGVVYTHANFLAQVDALKREFNITPGEVDLATFPLFALYAPAMGMTSIIPDMNFTQPGKASPKKLFSAIKKYNATTMFGSPALINNAGRYGEQHNVSLPTLRRVLSAGAPVPPRVLALYASLLNDDVQVFTPYGATECLPVASIGSQEVLTETRKDTDAGKGICVGKPVSCITVNIIPLSNEIIASWHPASALKPFMPGEIVVMGPQVTGRYYNRQAETAQAKIYGEDGEIYHRMGDTGYLDEKGRLWFCGRKAHCVVYNKQVYYSICCEGVFNVHHKVFRSALVALKKNGETTPAMCIELEDKYYGDNKKQLIKELMELGKEYDHTRVITDFFFHPSFPVDIRHNAKINRHKLAAWAQRKLR